MDLLQLKYFQTVARTEHITKAAEELHISQPSLSKVIARLEEDLEVPLFNREGRQIKLNNYGKAFLRRVNRIFTELEDGKRELYDMRGTENNTITVALNVMSLFPELLKEYLKVFPNTRFCQIIGTIAEMKQQLENGTVDYCLSSPPIEGPGIECMHLYTEELCLIVPKGHRLAERGSIPLAEAADEQFISLKEGFGMRNLTEELCHQAGFTPNIFFESDTSLKIAELVNIGFGVALNPIPIWRNLNTENHVFLHIKEPICTREIGLSYFRGHYMSKSAEQFKAYIIEYFDNARCNDTQSHVSLQP
jgi:DNA-binding transcriptional LysR family regulator